MSKLNYRLARRRECCAASLRFTANSFSSLPNTLASQSLVETVMVDDSHKDNIVRCTGHLRCPMSLDEIVEDFSEPEQLLS
jgi:hypothetical protein